MKKTEVMRQLRAYGTAQNRKVYGRHFSGPMFGVSYANLGKLRRTLEIDHELAAQLWDTGNHDARVLAMMIADPAQSTARQLDGWAREANNGGLAAELSNLTAKARSAKQRAASWSRARDEWTQCTGWFTWSSLAKDDPSIDDDEFAACLRMIEARIHRAPNMARHAMNTAMISIGIRNTNLRKLALAAAKRIGEVEVDHGETSCTTPDAAAYIAKTLARRKKKRAARPARV